MRAARILGRLDVDVVLLQHEYGIFGGRDGDYVASLAEELSQPLVVTLHTVLSEPTPHQAEVLAAVCRQAELVIVMTETARRLLVEGGTLPGGQGSGRAARRPAGACAARRRVRAGNAPPGNVACARDTAPDGAAVPALDVRADLGGEGARDGDRGAARRSWSAIPRCSM